MYPEIQGNVEGKGQDAAQKRFLKRGGEMAQQLEKLSKEPHVKKEYRAAKMGHMARLPKGASGEERQQAFLRDLESAASGLRRGQMVTIVGHGAVRGGNAGITIGAPGRDIKIEYAVMVKGGYADLLRRIGGIMRKHGQSDLRLAACHIGKNKKFMLALQKATGLRIHAYDRLLHFRESTVKGLKGRLDASLATGDRQSYKVDERTSSTLKLPDATQVYDDVSQHDPLNAEGP